MRTHLPLSSRCPVPLQLPGLSMVIFVSRAPVCKTPPQLPSLDLHEGVIVTPRDQRNPELRNPWQSHDADSSPGPWLRLQPPGRPPTTPRQPFQCWGALSCKKCFFGLSKIQLPCVRPAVSFQNHMAQKHTASPESEDGSPDLLKHPFSGLKFSLSLQLVPFVIWFSAPQSQGAEIRGWFWSGFLERGLETLGKLLRDGSCRASVPAAKCMTCKF